MPRPPRLLWADDEPRTVKWYVEAVRREGYAVDMVLDAETALESVLEALDRYHLLVLDLFLPLGEAFPHRLPQDTVNERAGLEVARVLRASEDGRVRDLPVVVYSAMSGSPLWPAFEAELRSLGASVLVKPIEVQRLLDVVRDLIPEDGYT